MPVTLRWEAPSRSSAFDDDARTRLVAVEPDPERLATAAPALREWYNHRGNAAMMGGATDMTVADVIGFWADLRERGGRGFLTYVDDVLVGDMDLREVTNVAAEFAILVGSDAQKGRGLGTSLGAMLHVFAFRALGLEVVYTQMKRENARMQRVARALGYVDDASAAARRYADDDGCLAMSLTRDAFVGAQPEAWRAVSISEPA